jgi:hypothetical protein
VPDGFVVIWREAPERMISCVADGDKSVKVFSAEELDVPALTDWDADELIKQGVFNRSAVSVEFAQDVLGWNV